jgi:hypothetical protein
MGLVVLLNEQDKIINIDSSVITIQNSKGTLQNYQPLQINGRVNQVLVHEL